MSLDVKKPIIIMDDAEQGIRQAIARAYDDTNAGADFLPNDQLMYIIRRGLWYHMAYVKLTGISESTESDMHVDFTNSLLEMQDAKESIRNVILDMFKRIDAGEDFLSYEELMYIVRCALRYHMASTVCKKYFGTVSDSAFESLYDHVSGASIEAEPPIETIFPLKSNIDTEAELRALNAECDVDKEVSDSLYDYVSESRSEESTDWNMEELNQLSEKCCVAIKGVPSCQ